MHGYVGSLSLQHKNFQVSCHVLSIIQEICLSNSAAIHPVHFKLDRCVTEYLSEYTAEV